MPVDTANIWQTLAFLEVPEVFDLSPDEPVLPAPPIDRDSPHPRMLRAATRRQIALRGIGDDVLQALLDAGEIVELQAGERLVDFGREQPYIWLVLEGEARIARRVLDPRIPELHAEAMRVEPHARVIGRFRAGSWVGLPMLAWRETYARLALEEDDAQHRIDQAEHTLSELQRRRVDAKTSRERVALAREIETAHDALHILEGQLALLQRPSTDFAVEVLPPEPGTDERFRALRVPLGDAVELCSRFPALSTFVSHNIANAIQDRERLEELMNRNPLLRSMDAGQRQLFLQNSVRRKYKRTTEEHLTDQPYLAARGAHGKIALVVRGAAQVYMPSTKTRRGRLAADVTEGELIGHERLVSDKDIEALALLRTEDGRIPDEADPDDVATLQTDLDQQEQKRDTDVFLANNTEILEIDWLTLRWILASQSTSWLPALHWYRAGCAEIAPKPAHIVSVMGSKQGLGTTLLGYGMAAGLCRVLEQAYEVHPNPLAREIVIIDIQGQDTYEKVWKPAGYGMQTGAYRRPPELRQPGEDSCVEVRMLTPPPGRADDPTTLPLDLLAVVWPEELDEADDLLTHLRIIPPARYVVVTGMEQGSRLFNYLAEVIPGTGVTVCWVHDDPAAGYALADALPERLIRVDRVNATYRRKALARAAAAPQEWAEAGDTAIELPPFANGIVRILDDPEHAHLFDEGRLEELLDHAHDSPLARGCMRMARAVAGKTIGLALGGGGIWGTAHIGLIKELELSDVPIDYLAGTSFGSVVAGLYAGGGMAALDRLLEENCVRGAKSTLTGFVRTTRRSEVFRAMSSAFYDTETLGEAMDGILARATGVPLIPLECAEIPFLPISTNLDAGAPFATTLGTIGYGIRASSGLPPALPGMWWRGQRILDGAMVANVPAEMVRSYGADYVISANVVAPKDPEPEERGRGARLYDATVRRVTDAIRGMYLLSWKAGDDQGRLRADYRVDLWTEGAELFEWWKGWQIVEGAQAGLFRAHTAWKIHEHWTHRDGEDDPPYTRVRTRVEVELAD